MLNTTPDELPYATANSPRIYGKVRERAEDFVVDEVPAYAPTGSGEHLFVHFRKVDLTTPQAVTRMAEALGVDPRGCGWAGLKDRKAVTTQWASLPGADPTGAGALQLEGIQILEAIPHGHKLRTGHLAGNRFRLLLREAGPSADDARSALEAIAAGGAPNYYGAQRFGRDGGNLEQASRWLLEGGRAPRDRFRRKLLVSVLQSALFNEWLADRVRRGELDGAVPGDLMRKEETGGQFVCEDAEADRARVQAWEISPTGPIFGIRMRAPADRALAIESDLRARWQLSDAQMAAFRKSGEGSRRVARIRPTHTRVEQGPEGIWVEFELPPGAYATTLLRELLGRDVGGPHDPD